MIKYKSSGGATCVLDASDSQVAPPELLFIFVWRFYKQGTPLGFVADIGNLSFIIPLQQLR
jgi:hypothetical protein